MDVPSALPTKGTASTPKSIAASSFKFVLIPSLSPADLKSISRRNLLQHRIPAARSLIWSGRHRSLYPETVTSAIPIIILSTFCRASISLLLQIHRLRDTVMGFVFCGWGGAQIFMCTSKLDLYLLPRAPSLTPVVFIILLQLG